MPTLIRLDAFAAFIFDMDGLLVNTTPVWRAAETRLLRRIGHEWSAELSVHYRGMNAFDVARTIHRLLRPELAVEQCQKLMRDALVEEYTMGHVEAMPGAVELVRYLRAMTPRRPIAVASGSPLMGIESALHGIGIYECFDVALTSEDVPCGKPAPDVFLAAAQRLGVEPGKCLVFEDALVGAQAAAAAGMTCFAVPSAEPDKVAAIATRCFTSLAKVVPARPAGAARPSSPVPGQ